MKSEAPRFWRNRSILTGFRGTSQKQKGSDIIVVEGFGSVYELNCNGTLNPTTRLELQNRHNRLNDVNESAQSSQSPTLVTFQSEPSQLK